MWPVRLRCNSTWVTLVPRRHSSSVVGLGGSYGLHPCQSHVLVRPCGSVVMMPSRVTLSLGMITSVEEGVGAYALVVSRMSQAHDGRIGVHTWPRLVHRSSEALWVLLGRGAGISAHVHCTVTFLVCSRCRLQPDLSPMSGGSTPRSSKHRHQRCMQT